MTDSVLDRLLAVWDHLRKSPPAPGRLVAVPCLPADPGCPLTAGILHEEETGQLLRLLILPVPVQYRSRVKEDQSQRGLRLSVLPAPGSDSRFLLALILTEEALADIFAVLAADVVAAVSPCTDDAARLRTFSQRLGHWQELFGLYSPTGLTGPQRQGLFGELYLLRELLRLGVPATVVVPAWVGPLHDLQDFRFGSAAVEVKTTAGRRDLTISHASQLADTDIGMLLLCHIVVEDSPGATTLPALVQELTDTLATGPASISTTLRTRLQQARYFDAQAGLYAATGYAVSSLQLGRVHADFPRLTPALLPAGITGVSYTLSPTVLGAYDYPISHLIDYLRSNG